MNMAESTLNCGIGSYSVIGEKMRWHNVFQLIDMPESIYRCGKRSASGCETTQLIAARHRSVAWRYLTAGGDRRFPGHCFAASNTSP
jgi:hypothetical protein